MYIVLNFFINQELFLVVQICLKIPVSFLLDFSKTSKRTSNILLKTKI